MTLFIDASAMVATITDEEGSHEIEARFGAADTRLCSAIVLWETARALARKRMMTMAAAREELATFVSAFDICLVPLGLAEMSAAVDAQDSYGKGTGHSARLNMGDCFAYACAKTNDASLLYKGEDFIHTDLR